MMRETTRNLRLLKTTYDAIAVLLAERPYMAPTLREVATKAGYSASSTAYEHVRSLKAQGFVDYDPATPRSIRILRPWPVSGEHAL